MSVDSGMLGSRRWLPVLLAAIWLAAMGLVVATRMSVTVKGSKLWA